MMPEFSRVSRIIGTIAFFLVSTIILYLLNLNGILPQILFLIGFGVILLVSIGIIFYPIRAGEWQELKVIPIKRKK
jgi:membrane protease YdiL (CAAX protease family)